MHLAFAENGVANNLFSVQHMYPQLTESFVYWLIKASKTPADVRR